MKKIYFKNIVILTLITLVSIKAQTSINLKEIAAEYNYNNNNQLDFIKLKSDYIVTELTVETFLNTVVLNNSSVKVKKIKNETDNLGYRHSKYQLYFKNIPINNSIIVTHSQNEKIISINGNLSAIQKPSNSVTIKKDVALQFALKKVNAKLYKWQNKVEEQQMKQVLNNPNFSYFPKGDLVLYSKENFIKSNAIQYAYKFNIYAQEPLYKANVYVDAQSGAILAEENLICHADVTSTVVTKYSGTQTVTTDNFAANSYRLRETSRGLGVETYNMQNTTTYSATDFTNATTTWSVVNFDQAARDAHWGAEQTYDYYFSAHNRNSIDNAGFKLLSYVHYDSNYNNAFWDGIRMTYGDGNGTTFSVLTALDVCGHEITHGLTENTSNLVYSNESGALNESFSDIFGTLVENYARPTNWDWKIGEDMTPNGQGIRNMSNPNLFSDPDTYNGTHWYSGTADNGGVHTNSGVGNYWFYILSQGGTGTNDINNPYTVAGIGKVAAAQIAFRALTVYFTPTTNYLAARNYAIQAAKDIFGNCSNEVVQTTNAWYAVGVGLAYNNLVTSDFVANSTSYCSLPAVVNFNNTSINGNTYKWYFGDGNTSLATNTSHTYTSAGTYTVSLKANGCLTSSDSIAKPAYIIINPPNTPISNSASRCGPGTVSLSASGTSQLYWYASPSATGTPINVGTNYVTPFLNNNTTYYVVNTSTNTPVFGAATNTSIGTGGNFNNNTHYQIFDVMQASTLKSVVVYASTAGNRTIELRNALNSVITSTTVNLPVGSSTVNLNFALTPGSAYRLGLSPSSAINLYRNNAGGAYPYNIGGIANVTGSSAGGGFYYFFYNWQVQKNNCISSPVPVTANINTAPALTVNSNSICSGQSITLSANNANTYTWSTGSNLSSINVSPLTTTVFTIMASNGVGCNASATSTVTVLPNPVVSVNSTVICSGQIANLTANGATSYSWSSGQNSNIISVAPSTSIIYTVYGYSGLCAGSSTANITVNQLPVISITASQNMACSNDGTISLTGSPSGGTYSGAGVIGNSFNPAIGTGNYFVNYQYTDANNCSASDSINIMVSICTGVANNNNVKEIELYPNPAHNYFIVNSFLDKEITLTIIDASGRLILKKEIKSTQEKINIATLTKGIYFVEIKGKTNASYRSKIIKD